MTEPTNEERADRIYRLMLVYKQYLGFSENKETYLIDLLTDLLHYCDEMGLDYDRAITTARMHHAEETCKENT